MEKGQHHSKKLERELPGNLIKSRVLRLWPYLFLSMGLLAYLAWISRDQLSLLFYSIISLFEHREAIRDFILSFGPLAPVAYILLQALQVIVSPIPGEATGLLGGFFFGEWMGFFYATAGLTLGSLGAFWIARQFRRLIRNWLKRSSYYKKFENLMEHQGIFLCFMLFLLPGFPKDFLCYLLGLSRMPWQAFFIIMVLGRMPGTFMLTLQGAQVFEGNFLGVFMLLLFTLLIGGPAWYYREKIYAWVEQRAIQE